MQTVEEIIEQARHLSPQDRQRLVEQLEELSGEEQTTASGWAVCEHRPARLTLIIPMSLLTSTNTSQKHMRRDDNT